MARCGFSPLRWPKNDSIQALVVGGGRASEVLGDPGAGHEHRGRLRRHLRAVVADGQQHRDPFVVVWDDPGRELGEQLLVQEVALGVREQGGGERDLHLGAALLPRIRGWTTTAGTPRPRRRSRTDRWR